MVVEVQVVVGELVRVLLALVEEVVNNSNNRVVKGFIEQVIILHVPKMVMQHHKEEEEGDTIVPADPTTKEDHVNPTLPKQSSVLPPRGPIPPHRLYRN